MNTGFNRSELILSIAIINKDKIEQAAFVTEIESNLKSNESEFYTQEMLDNAKKALNKTPDSYELFTIENEVYHGPFPLISQFNFKPGLATIHSSVHYTDLSSNAQKILSEELTEQSAQLMQSHLYFTADSFIGLNGSMDLTASMPAFVMNSKNEGDLIFTFGGIDLNLMVNEGLNEINLDNLNNINLKVSLNKTSLADLQNSIDFDGIDFSFNADKVNNLSTFSQHLKLLPFKFRAILHQSNIPSVIDYEGIDFTHTRGLNADNINFDESIKIESKPFSSNITIDDSLFLAGYKNTKINVSDVKIDFTAMQLSTAFYHLYTPFIEKMGKEIKSYIGINHLGYGETVNQPAPINQVLAILRILSNNVTLKIAPFNVSVVENNINNGITTTWQNETQIDAIRWDIKPQFIDNDKLLNFNLVLDRNEFKNDDEGNLETEFDLKGVNFAYMLPLMRVYPMTLDSNIESLTFNRGYNPNVNFNDLKLSQTIKMMDNDTFRYDQIYALDRLNFMGAELGSFDLQLGLENLNPEGLHLITQNVATALNNYDKKYQSYEEVSLTNELTYAFGDSYLDIIKTLSSKGPTLSLFPAKLASDAGETNMNLRLEIRSLAPELLDSIQNPVGLFMALLNGLSFNASVDINYVSDIAAKFKLLNEAIDSYKHDNIDPASIEVEKARFKDSLTQLVNQPPINLFIEREDNLLKTEIIYSDNRLKINGKAEPLSTLLPGIVP